MRQSRASRFTALSLPVVLLAIIMVTQLAESVLEQIADVSGVARTTE
ncbi:MAG: hypothetical protein ACRDTA_02720 [Pseudonocardiaceae bacterium]